MKKIISLLLTLVLVISLCTVVSAEGKKDYLVNISLNQPEGYEKTHQGEDCISYFAEESLIFIDYEKDFFDEDDGISSIKDIGQWFGDYIYDEEYILNDFDYGNLETKVIFSDITSEHTYTEKGIPVFKYSKDYRIEAEGYHDYNGFFISVMFIDGNDLYFVELSQSSSKNSYFEFNDMCNSIELSSEKYAANADGTIKIIVNGEVVTPDSAPVIVNDRTLCPIRAVAEELGYEVSWNAQTRTANIKNNLRDINVTIGEKYITGQYLSGGLIGGYYKDLKKEADVPATIINDRTYLPLRAVGEALGCEVYWNADKRTVIINTRNHIY
ncbi:MAG: copper amine oxidase N-terminal domain-containing protein [Clostridia bacterium]|nr:copper amine oxidase N-terminal domain-containing protein [Clostridia bacterium]